jgi:xanthine/uracil/vitamin C permease (AzgA family)
MTRRLRWWTDAAVVVSALVVGFALWSATSVDDWIVRGIASALPVAAVVGIGWSRRRWPPS